jgi:alcohol dehydrogenase class IV
MMRPLAITSPRRLLFGSKCATHVCDDLAGLGLRRVFIVTAPPVLPHAEPLAHSLRESGASVRVSDAIREEPTLATFGAVLTEARDFRGDAIVGIGGGSVLDVAKLLAGLLTSRQSIAEALGINQLTGRSTYLACLPTTAGTGSEVSPNALLLDEATQAKKASISPHLVPDAAYVDPLLTVGVPPGVTAATGIDALTHCIEAYANRFAHPMIDLYALEGVRLISRHLKRAVVAGDDLEAREAVALGSLYGGLCLGPVNTGAVHALAYPLGGEFHLPHGLSNALLLPHVLRFNAAAAPKRYAQIAMALGAAEGTSEEETARKTADHVAALLLECGLPTRLSEVGVPAEACPRLVQSALTVTRLLKNNPREVTAADAEAIYHAAF